MGSSLLSDLLGWASIGCWLGAQFPQVLENIRRQSCEGLALPFLLNWLLGDVTNLVGCLLTHQLPFQTILATYFVSVDFMLFSQYFYYRSRAAKTAALGGLEPSPVQRYSTHSRRFSTDHDHHYRELSNAAANVAIAAALAASEEELHMPAKDALTLLTHRRSSTSITRSEAAEAADEVDEAALAALADSFHSDTGRNRVSWSQERYSSGRGGSTSRTRSSGYPPLSPLTPLYTSLNTGPTDSATGIMDSRGRPLQRQILDSPIDGYDIEGHTELAGRSLSRSLVKDRRSSRASQRSVGLVFLGVWALFGIGTLSRPNYSISSTPRGHVLSEFPHPTPLYSFPEGSTFSGSSFEKPSTTALVLEQRSGDDAEEPSSERIIGRIFAWMCTTLYLTSRLPQIWKNFVRKSVEGLSMYLFVFAFLGNTFYVLSILASPMMSQSRPASTAFLLESMPYLLGSGGTLLFDVTIVSQSFLYRPRPGHGHHHQRNRPSHSRSLAGSHGHVQKHSSIYGSTVIVPEEEQALLSSPVHDLERGARANYGLENEWTLQQPGQTRRRKDASDGESEQTVS